MILQLFLNFECSVLLKNKDLEQWVIKKKIKIYFSNFLSFIRVYLMKKSYVKQNTETAQAAYKRLKKLQIGWIR